MTVQVVYKNKAKSSNSGVIALFADEKFQIKNRGDFLSNNEFSYIEKISKSKKNTKDNIISFNINEKTTIILIAIKKDLKSFNVENLGANFYNFINSGSLFGGKKIRSTIILNTSKIFNINFNQIINVCAAVECVHSYSLIHDDLPCMDNDRLRRGKPSTHIKFGESTAILAGNSLLTLAFEMIADQKFKLDTNIKLS